MNWFEKYSQEETLGLPEEGGLVESDGDGQAYERIVFDGVGVNQIVVKRILTPLNSVDAAVYKFLMTLKSNSMSQALVGLAEGGILPMFKKSVESYVKDGYADDVATGTETGLMAFQEWIADFKRSGGSRSPFLYVEDEINKFIGI